MPFTASNRCSLRERTPSRFSFAAPALLLSLLLLCAFCLTAGSASAEPAGVRLPGHVPQAAISHAVLKGYVQPSQPIKVSFVLPLRNQAELNTLIQRLYNPKDPLYGHYLTPDEFTEEFGPTQADVNAVESYARSEGLSVVNVSSNHTLVEAEGPASTVNQALSVRLRWYTRGAGRPFYAPNADPLVPASIASKIVGIVGLDNSKQYHPQYLRRNPLAPVSRLSPQIGTGVQGSGLDPTDIKKAYNLTGASVNGGSTPLDGTGQTLALYELDGYKASDITTYETTYKLPNVTLQNIPIDGGVTTLGGGEDEVTLDIELMIALAPKVTKIQVYEAPNTSQGSIDILNQMVTNKSADAISMSWGISEDVLDAATMNAENSAFSQLASEGESFYVASGDNGAFDDPAKPTTPVCDDPAVQPFVTGVGGTTLVINADGSYNHETTWDEIQQFGIGGGGGFSTFFGIPGYQQPIVSASNDTELSAIHRNVPDVSLDADPDNSGYSIYTQGAWTTFGGTSCAAPLWAAFTALLNQQRVADGGGDLGFANPTLYQIAQLGISYPLDFHDIADNSNNGHYHAVAGYDDATGLGTINGLQMLSDIILGGLSLDSNITGTVTDANTLQPIGGAVVTENLAGGGQEVATATTKADGTYTIPAPASLGVTLDASAATYEASAPQTVTSAAKGGTVPGINFALISSPFTFGTGWEMISTPYDYVDTFPGTTIDTILGLPSTIHEYWWDPTAAAYNYSPIAPANTFQLGVGYWIDAPAVATIPSIIGPSISLPGALNISGQTTISLLPGWNMVGNPYDTSVPTSSIGVQVGTAAMTTYASALSAGSVSVFYTYQTQDNPPTGNGTYETIDQNGSLPTWEGFWIFAKKATTLTIPMPTPPPSP